MSAVDWQRFPLFAELLPADRARLADLLEERSIATGAELCREGAEADAAFLLDEGALDCTRGETGPLGRIEAPAVLGIASLAERGPREASLTAAAPSRVLLLTRAAFLRFAEDAPAAAMRVLEATVRELGGLLRSGIDGLAPPRG